MHGGGQWLAVFMRIRIGATIRTVIVLIFAMMCVMAVLQPQRWLFLFRKSFTSAVLLGVLFILYGLAGKLK
jgi:hypothetical protein